MRRDLQVPILFAALWWPMFGAQEKPRVSELCDKATHVMVASMANLQNIEGGIIVGLYPLTILKGAAPDTLGKLPDLRVRTLWIPRSANVALDALFRDPQRFLVFLRPAPPDLFPPNLLPQVEYVLADSKFGTLPGDSALVNAARKACAASGAPQRLLGSNR